MQLTRKTFLKTGAAGIAAVMTGAAYSTFVEPNRLSLERVITRIPHLPTALEGLRIAILSDFHLHPFTTLSHIQDAINLANSLKPDLTVLLGDYVDSDSNAIYELTPALNTLNARLGLYGILGNHDHWSGGSLVNKVLLDAGIPVLKNSGIPLAVASHTLFLAGIDSVWAAHPDLNLALARCPAGTPAILLAHEPDYADYAAADGRISLQLSGHSHGGQVRVPGIGAIRLPRWGRKYDQGLYRVGNMGLYTTRGIGLLGGGLPIRINCPPEVTEVTLAAV
jgi:predicted MPP superfamily phosphohydrolase